jgi:hypothetical protein
VKVRDDQIRKKMTQADERIDPVARGGNFKSLFAEDERHHLAHARVVIHE